MTGLPRCAPIPERCPFFVDNATRWVADFRRKQVKSQETGDYEAMLLGKRNR